MIVSAIRLTSHIICNDILDTLPNYATDRHAQVCAITRESNYFRRDYDFKRQQQKRETRTFNRVARDIVLLFVCY